MPRGRFPTAILATTALVVAEITWRSLPRSLLTKICEASACAPASAAQAAAVAAARGVNRAVAALLHERRGAARRNRSRLAGRPGTCGPVDFRPPGRSRA